MLILALDASTPVVAVGLARADADGGREVLAEVSVQGSRQGSRGASESLLPAVHDVLRFSGCGLEEVERVLVGVGPGTFTGIRIAAAVARGLAFGQPGARLTKNSTLAALAAPALYGSTGGFGTEVLAVIDARRGQVFARRFRGPGSLASPVGEGGISCSVPGELAAGGEPGRETLVVGDGAVRYRAELSRLGHIPPDASPLHRVTATGHVLSADLAPMPAGKLVPIYVREPDAEVRRDLNPWSGARGSS
ncbi:MAG: tRNA (adenosine(37)-N6)-threonylcarbamoyltransferase complex dimerization subunit type 1 TsaB [Rubrobacter sp.]|nr:tRNA (adenosine(37)-N6)-threonylcarbamoyltransferase complex dimerization subunit type 1 TsaB [Rubrobacter sp.]